MDEPFVTNVLAWRYLCSARNAIARNDVGLPAAAAAHHRLRLATRLIRGRCDACADTT